MFISNSRLNFDPSPGGGGVQVCGQPCSCIPDHVLKKLKFDPSPGWGGGGGGEGSGWGLRATM